MKKNKELWFWIGFFLNMTIAVFVLMMNIGCNGEYGIRVEDILLTSVTEHEVCKNKHYVDPYTKREYCLPDNFTNMRNIHIYIVEETND